MKNPTSTNPIFSLPGSLESATKQKKRIYQKAVEDRRGQFTPFVVSVDGLLHREANHFMRRTAASLLFVCFYSRVPRPPLEGS